MSTAEIIEKLLFLLGTTLVVGAILNNVLLQRHSATFTHSQAGIEDGRGFSTGGGANPKQQLERSAKLHCASLLHTGLHGWGPSPFFVVAACRTCFMPP